MKGEQKSSINLPGSKLRFHAYEYWLLFLFLFISKALRGPEITAPICLVRWRARDSPVFRSGQGAVRMATWWTVGHGVSRTGQVHQSLPIIIPRLSTY